MPKGGGGREAISRALLWLAVIDVMLGALLTLAGELVWARPDVSLIGVGLVVAGGLLYGLLRLLGARFEGADQEGRNRDPRE